MISIIPLGIFCCGPCPVKAIKWGDVHLPYDAGFVFGEVNGDRIYWEVDETTGDMEVIRIEECAVGKNISTKAVGSNAREDLTQYYKHMDGMNIFSYIAYCNYIYN